MRARSTAGQWVAVAATCAMAAVLTGPARALPPALQRGIEGAVDGVARLLLWTWDSPAAWDEAGQRWDVRTEDTPASRGRQFRESPFSIPT